MRKDHGANLLPNISQNHRIPNPSSSKKKKRVFFFMVLIIILGGGALSHQVFFSKKTVEPLKSITKLPIIRGIRDITGANDGLIKGETVDRINILILGQGGAGHDGPYLTDTNIIASYKPSTGQIALLSLPRDMLVTIPSYGPGRINLANSFGETSGYPGGGGVLAARVVEDTLKIPINYYIRIDFAGFEQLIDDLGGVTIDVERAFTDEQYPDGALGFKTVHFDAGKQKFSGEKALQYVRSRHAPGEAGDFARAYRQQKLLVALKDKILTPSNLLNPSRLFKLYQNATKHVSTNAQNWELKAFLSLAQQADFDTITYKILDDSPGGPLYSTTTSDGAYVLAPKIPNYSEIRFIAKNLFTINDIKQEKTQLVIQNGTSEEGLAKQTAEILRVFEFSIITITNAPSKNYKKTVLYDLTSETKPNSRKFLESTLRVKAQKTLPITDAMNADFLIILGSDQVPNTHAQNTDDNLNAL